MAPSSSSSLPGATSPYAPSRRNSFLRRRSSSSVSLGSISSGGGSQTAIMAIVLFVIRFWRDVYRHRIAFWETLKPQRLGVSLERLKEVVTERIPRRLMPSLPTATTTNTSQTLPSSSAATSTSIKSQRPQQDIHDVLAYWFGQYPPDVAQKMLWMIGSSSVQLREKVDEEIACKFESLLLELSSSSSSLEEQARNYTVDNDNDEDDNGDLLDGMSSRWKEWCLDPRGIYGAHGKIAAILVLDQFSRHVLRHYHEQTKNHKRKFPTQQSLDQLALQTAKLFVKRHKNEIQCGMIPLPMYIFALMPYRHANTSANVQYVQQCVEETANRTTQMESMLGRFRKATNRRMAILQDEARRTGGEDKNKKQQALLNNQTDRQSEEEVSTELSSSFSFTDEDILETFPFEADMTSSQQHPIHKTIVQFLNDQGIHPSTFRSDEDDRHNNIIINDNNNKDSAKAAVIVSLSGGVDSMVIASVLAYLKRCCGYDHLNIIAVHIDYANRPESGAEAKFVERYCSSEYLDITFQCRRIGEVTRGITARDDYERVAREIRYNSYREAVATAKTNMGLFTDHERDVPIVGVMLGHHRGDLRENVLSNAHKGCGPLDLSGMTAVSKNDGIIVYRPLLPLEKSFVLDYAHKFGVPYFKDTTPHWSTRGKLRIKLLPLLEEIYGDGSMNNLSNLAVESDECRALLHKSVIGPFLDSIIRKPMGIIMDTAPWKDQPIFFWKVVLREALHSACLGMFSDKSVLAFLERVKAKILKAAWLQCRKDYGVYLQKDGKVMVFYPSCFPWNKKDFYNVDGQAVEFETDTMVGPWRVRSEVVAGELNDSNMHTSSDFLTKKAVPSMESLMDGNIEYFVVAPTIYDKVSNAFTPRPLIFRQFNKADRPLAWKNSDLRVQTTLPLLGNAVTTNTSMKDTTCCGLVNDNVDGKRRQNPDCLIRISMQLTPHHSQ